MDVNDKTQQTGDTQSLEQNREKIFGDLKSK